MIKHYVVPLTGAAQRLSDFLGSGFTTPGHGRDVRTNNITFSVLGSNSNPVYIGGRSDISSSDHLLSVPAPTGGVPPAPMVYEIQGRQFCPSDWYVRGTNGETLFFGFVE